MFDHVGRIVYKPDAGTADQVLEAAINAGAEDVQSDATGHTITTAFNDLNEVAKNLEATLGEAASVKIIWHPRMSTPLDEDKAEAMVKLVGILEDDDDVQEVYSNFEVSDAVMR